MIALATSSREEAPASPRHIIESLCYIHSKTSWDFLAERPTLPGIHAPLCWPARELLRCLSSRYSVIPTTPLLRMCILIRIWPACKMPSNPSDFLHTQRDFFQQICWQYAGNQQKSYIGTRRKNPFIMRFLRLEKDHFFDYESKGRGFESLRARQKNRLTKRFFLCLDFHPFPFQWHLFVICSLR